MTNAPERLAVEGLRRHPDGLLRCWWCGDDADYVAYHDREWGRPVHDDRRLFEKLCLEGFQAGLSWLTILRKRPAFRAAFAAFEPEVVAAFGAPEVEQLLADASIVRSRAKIEATIDNARALLRLWESGGSLDALAWSFAPTAGRRRRPRSPTEVPDVTSASTALARELKSQGFRFVGPTTAYAFMQAMGLVDDHLEGCHLPPADRA
ncbi:MAG: DNA-3-methyladenine glycosylase I [Actinomycetota bacterium]